jgi:hypothetical protein
MPLPNFCRNTLTDTPIVLCPPLAVVAALPNPTLPLNDAVNPATPMQYAGIIRQSLPFWNAITDPDRDAVVVRD